MFVQAQLRIMENFYFQYRQGLMNEAIINAHRNSLLNNFFFDNNVARFQWESTRGTFDPEFIAWVDAAFASKPPTHIIASPLFESMNAQSTPEEGADHARP
jgi:hypothetical protein